MGCGAICGNETQQQKQTKIGQVKYKKLLLMASPNAFLYPFELFKEIMEDMQLHPHRYQLGLTPKLLSKFKIVPGVLEKWKILLFSLDFDNTSYVNCLGYGQFEKKKNPSKQNIEDNNQEDHREEKVVVYQHKCFKQIQKDLDRTFQLPQLEKEKFSYVLKRISNHFPTMGYTQGINFIVGYLIIIGFSDKDAFWIFIHIALNKRFLLLGLFEDNFPLSNVYKLLFKNMLKRCNPKLFEHLYHNLCLDESIWVFKWFITFYLYSFPLELCQHIWDFVLTVGGTGLVIFAISLVTGLQKQLLQIEDPCDASEFFQELKDIDKFNEYLNLNEIIENAYKLQIKESDLEGIKDLKDKNGQVLFYADYIYLEVIQQNQEKAGGNNYDETDPMIFKNRGKTSASILQKWHSNLQKERKAFKQSKLANQINYDEEDSLIMYLQETNRTIENKKKNENKVLQNNEFTFKDLQNAKISSGENEDKLSIRYSHKKVSTEIDELEDDSCKQRQDKYEVEDSLFYLTNNLNLKNKNSFSVSSHESIGNKMKKINRKAQKQNEQIEVTQIAKAGKNIVTSLSVSNASNRSSISQKTNTKESKFCKCCSKSKVGQKQIRMQKVKIFTNITNQFNTTECDQRVQRLNERKKTLGNDWLANSQGPKSKLASLIPIDLGTQVQIFQGTQMFKKKNRVQGNGMGIINYSEKEVSQCTSRYEVQKIGGDEESYDSLFIGNISSQKSSMMSCEIESVK